MKSNGIQNGFAAFVSNHKLITIIAALVLLIALATAIILLTLGNAPAPDDARQPKPNPVTNGVEERVFYYDLPGGTTVMTLMNNYKYTFVGPDHHKSGEYFIDGDKITLDFVRNSDGVASATLEGGKLTVIWQEATLTFREKIDYTVSFNTNGAGKIDNVTVMNGKTLANQPANPEKAGYIFEGWYTDEALTKPFSFGITLITSDTVLYAKWTEAAP